MSSFTLEKYEKMSSQEIWQEMKDFTELINDAPNRREQIAREYEFGILANLHALAQSRENAANHTHKS